VTGDAVNVANRLEQTAGNDEILIGEETWRLVQDAVRIEPVGEPELRGRGRPTRAYRLLEVLPDAPGISRRLDVRLVGNEAKRRHRVLPGGIPAARPLARHASGRSLPAFLASATPQWVRRTTFVRDCVTQLSLNKCWAISSMLGK